MDAATVLSELLETIDKRQWTGLAKYLHPDFSCRYVHTGESFDAESWISLNADYPGFDRLRVEDLVGAGDAAAARSHVTGIGDTGMQHFECATFIRMREGLILEMTEVWTDVDQQAPPGTRPA